MFARLKVNKLKKKAKNLYNKRESGASVNVKTEVKVLKDIAKFYEKHLFHKKFPQAAVLRNEYYRAAAGLEDAESQYILGKTQTGRR